MPEKSPQTAVVAIPPEEVWAPIQAIRRAHDRHVDRWMPHVTLLYPFVPPEEISTADSILSNACIRIAAIEATLAGFSFFGHDRSATVWLAPEPRREFVSLQAALAGCFPGYEDAARYPGGFKPHLSVGQAESATEAKRLIESLKKSWKPISFRLDSVALIRRKGEEPFEVAAWFPLAPSLLH